MLFFFLLIIFKQLNNPPIHPSKNDYHVIYCQILSSLVKKTLRIVNVKLADNHHNRLHLFFAVLNHFQAKVTGPTVSKYCHIFSLVIGSRFQVRLSSPLVFTLCLVYVLGKLPSHLPIVAIVTHSPDKGQKSVVRCCC